MSLRRTVAIATLLLTTLAVVIAGALVLLTTRLHRTTLGAAIAVESIRIVEEVQLDLLHHGRARDALIKREIESDLRRRLIEARQYAGSEEEAAMISEAESRIDVYIDAAADPSRSPDELVSAQEKAYGALRDLATINVVQANIAEKEAARSNELANVIGVGALVLLLLVAGSLLLWLRWRAFEPVIALAATMERFAAGDPNARAVERGPKELREMCRRFNEMAQSITAQRHAQMAFLGGVAHDLRNPLSALQMSVILLQSDRSLPTNDRLRAPIERIARQLERMDRMIGDFLDGARIEAGLLELRIELHDIRTIVRDVVALFEGMSAKHSLTVQLPDHAVLAGCDSLRIEQVITNLISNAIKYSPAGGAIEVTLRTAALELELGVRDHGVGIPDASVARLFEPFRRLGLSSGAVPGVGLGLFVVRRIIEAHGGRVEVESVVGEGSTFRVFLPVQCASA
ncbi:MAG: HAMP domain-containing protein [Deltaproteobacteria bacterium]|nr:HAMP domain-containing protein [Deltaproteobacteria bacterium]